MIYPQLQATKDNQFFLLEEYKYRGVRIPIGYTTNGADIPRIFWSFVPPFKPKFLPAVLVHDFLIETAKTTADVNSANDHFEEILFQIEKSFKTRIMVLSVKLYWKFKSKFKEVRND
jgi:hypothetical protein